MTATGLCYPCMRFGRGLCPVPDVCPRCDARSLSVVADAVTTPFEAISSISGLGLDDIAVLVGVGGVGRFRCRDRHGRWCRRRGHLMLTRRSSNSLTAHGASLTLNAADSFRERTSGSAVVRSPRDRGARASGEDLRSPVAHPQGESVAFGLLDYGGYPGVSASLPRRTELRLFESSWPSMPPRTATGAVSRPWRCPSTLALVLRREDHFGTLRTTPPAGRGPRSSGRRFTA